MSHCASHKYTSNGPGKRCAKWRDGKRYCHCEAYSFSKYPGDCPCDSCSFACHNAEHSGSCMVGQAKVALQSKYCSSLMNTPKPLMFPTSWQRQIGADHPQKETCRR